jgi:hypothetical protein
MFVEKFRKSDFTEWWGTKEYRYNRIVVQRSGKGRLDDSDYWSVFFIAGQEKRGPITLGARKGRDEAEEFAKHLMDFASYFEFLGMIQERERWNKAKEQIECQEIKKN